jgi:hypothetical protein
VITLTSHETSQQGISISHRVRRDIREAARIHSRRFVTRAITVADTGERLNNTKTMNTSQFSLANRKQLADMLGNDYHSLRSRAKDKLREKRQELFDSLVKEYAEKKGALKVKAQIDATREKLEEQQQELKLLGFFFYDDGQLRLAGDAGTVLTKTINARLDKEIGTSDEIDVRFNSVQIAMMTVASLEDADTLLKSVSTI